MDFRPEVFTPSYWMDVPAIEGQSSRPKDGGGILVIGSGLSGVSAAYWLKEAGFEDLTLVDYALPHAATFRNCGHILYGTVESMKALVALHGRETAREIWEFSIGICHEVRETVRRLGIDCEYEQSGYLVIAIDEVEDGEIRESIELLGSMGFESRYVEMSELRKQGFRNVCGGRFEAGSAQAHPMKFRNGVLRHCLDSSLSYHSGVEVTAVEEEGDHVIVTTKPWGKLRYDACVIAANAYSPLLSRFFAERRLVEPFRGQIITSKPLQHDFKVRHPHSFDHGYEYALVTSDNRLMIGGWRNNTPGGELGTYDIDPNKIVEQGLKDFVDQYYDISEKIEWEYSWAGIMAASKTGFPFIGPTTSPRIYTCSGYTGHGFSWAHGSAKLLADIMAGNPITGVAKHFNPKW
jgi:gamma-glutamylputrescine oxidase